MSNSKSADLFESSDSSRSGKPLRFAQYVTFDEPITLAAGDVLPSVTVCYETYGRLSPQRDNAVLICHALTGDSHVASHDDEDDPGWWDILIGPGKPVDTDKYFVICPNVLGGCRGTTGPNSIHPETGKPFGSDFPVVQIEDIVDVQRRLVDHLGIDQLHGVIGGSLGGFMALTWGVRLPSRVRGVVAMATSPRLTSQGLAFDVVGRNAITSDPEYQGGQFYSNGQGPLVGLAIARMLGHITYLSREAMTSRFDVNRMDARNIKTRFETKFAVGSYLAYQGDRFGDRFDANSYVTLSTAMDLFDLGGTAEELREAFAVTKARWLVMSFSTDWLFLPFQSREIVNALIANNRPVTYCNVISKCGHDAFLLADDLESYGEMTRAFLDNIDEGSDHAVANPVPERPTSIFQNRLEYDTLLEMIPPKASVLDLGCGGGEFLGRLQDQGHHHVVGLELDERAILACIQRGLDVVQVDLNEGLAAFSDGQFDVVVLSQTLQAIRNVERVIREMLRVGKHAIVSFPNAAYAPLRERLAEHGLSPQTDSAQGYHWFNTPSVRTFSIRDFEDFCRMQGIRIERQIAIDTRAGTAVTEHPNMQADIAIMMLSR
jgi:homoserine O-acetyltransferase/O-succinyltransferase